jgi:GxxExxY protein
MAQRRNDASSEIINLDENAISRHVVAAALEVHKVLGGPGLLESVYEEALAWELIQRRLHVERQKLLPIVYKGTELASPLRLDMLVNDLVIVECKAVPQYNPIFQAQALTYLRVTGLKLALIINFGSDVLRTGIRRVVNGL